MISLTDESNQIFHRPSITTKDNCLSENSKILRAIQNKISPLNISPKTKKFRMQLAKKLSQPTVNKQFCDWKSQENRLKNYECEFRQRNSESQDFSQLKSSLKRKNKVMKKVKTIQLRSSLESQRLSWTEAEKIDFQRLPLIKKDIEQRKQDLAKSIQQNSLKLQRDNFRPMEKQKVCNLEYLLNRLDVSYKRRKAIEKNDEPLRGYENLSPNRLKEYIKMFKEKMSAVPQAIYVSKKRIALSKNNNQNEEGETFRNFKFRGLKSEKKLVKLQKNVILQNKKISRNEVYPKQVLGKNVSRKEISRNYISRKEIEPKMEMRKFSSKKFFK